MKLFSHLITLSKRITRKGIYPFLEEQLSTVSEDAKVLLVGAGGQIEELVLSCRDKNKFQLETIDVDPERKPTLLGDVHYFKFFSEDYDVIVLSEVLEHFYAPGQAIGNMRDALKPDGKMVITVPFIFPLHDRPHDYFRFTLYGLEHLLSDFRAVHIRPRTSWPEAIGILFVRLLFEPRLTTKLLGVVSLPLVFLLSPVFALAARLFPADFITAGYLAVAKK